MQRPLPSYPDHVTVPLGIRTCWVWFGAILPVLGSVGSSSSQMTGQGQRGQKFAMALSRRCVCLAEREEAPNGAANPLWSWAAPASVPEGLQRLTEAVPVPSSSWSGHCPPGPIMSPSSLLLQPAGRRLGRSYLSWRALEVPSS